MGTSTARAQLIVQAKDEASSVLRGIAGQTEKVGGAASGASGGLGKFGGALSSIATIAAGVGLGISLQGLAQGAIQFGQASIKMAMDMEQTKVGFTTMLGSAKAAEDHLRSLRDFAAGTPFQFTELVDSSKRLQAFGFEAQKVIPMLRDIGDAVAAMGGGGEKIDRVTMALGQMQAKGKVSAEEMLQLTEAGIPGWKYLAQAVGVSTAEVQKMTSKGLIPAGDAIQYILDGMRQDFGGMMAAQSSTAAGQLSNLQDKLEQIQTILGEKMLPVVKEWIRALSQAGDAVITLITWDDRLRESLHLHEADLRKTADGYDAYSAELLRATGVAGLSVDAHGNLVRVLHGLAGTTTQVVEANFSLTRSAFAGWQAAQQYNEGLSEAARAQARLTPAIQETAEAIDAETLAKYRAKEASDLLAAATKGPLGEAQAKYKMTQAEVNAEIAKTRAELDEYVAKEAAAVASRGAGSEAAAEYRDKIAEAQAKLGDLTGKLDTAAGSLQRVTAEFIFQKAAAGLDADAALELARKMGLVDEASYATAKAVADLRDKYDKNKDGSISAAEGAAQFTREVATLNQTIQGLQDKDVTITVTTIQNEIRNRYLNELHEKTGTGRQHGGPVIPGQDYRWQESVYTRPETLIVGQMGQVMTRQQMAAAMAQAGGGASNDAILMALRALPQQMARAVRDAMQLAW